MAVLHGQVREGVKKTLPWTTLIIIDFGCGTKHLQCELRFKGVLLLQNDEWHQTASRSRYFGQTVLHTLHES